MTDEARRPSMLPSRANGANGAHSAESERRLLRARAEVLARPLAPLVDRSNDVEFAVFSVDGERFALETAFVREVMPLPEVTPLPGRARVLVGITSLRGEIVPVAALARLFAGAAAPVPSAGYLVVLGRDRPEVSLLATGVEEVRGLDTSALSPSGTERKVTQGVMHDGLVVLDGAALLSDPRLFVEDDADS